MSALAPPGPQRPAAAPEAPATPVPATASTPARFTLAVVRAEARPLARAWLWLGLAALAGSGLFSVLLVLARTPGINAWLPAGDFFRTALVVHVDLSVLVWFVATGGLLWTLELRGAWPRADAVLAVVTIALCAAGALGMAAAAFVDPGTAVMSNYVPMLDSATFRGALAVFGAGALLLVLRALVQARPVGVAVDGAAALRFGLHASVVAAAVALMAFGWSLATVPAALPAKAYYEILFWGGGHALQFAWTLLMVVAWLALAQACGARVPLSARVVLLLMLLALIAVFVTPYAYVAHAPDSVEHRALHTWAMRAGGITVVPVALAVLPAVVRARAPTPAARALRAALLASMVLFLAGGAIGLAIRGSDVRIPAHYHGCIVGVTLALMGVVWHLLPQLGYRAPAGGAALAQPWLYGGGQLLHVVGLVWSGGYGVQRKVAGTEQVLRGAGETAGMALMGLGGGLAIAGGLLFVVVVARAMRAPRAAGTPARTRPGARSRPEAQAQHEARARPGARAR